MKPLISIGLPVKDGFKDRSQNDINLEKSLNSILSQTYENLEIIISDNCSEDETTKFLNKKVLSDKRIKLFNQKKEISWAENYKFVLEKSSGKYFKWNAADDLISENFIEENFTFLEKNLDFVCSSSKFFYENNKNNIHKFNLDKDLYSRLSGFFKIRHISHNILYSLVRRECMYKTVDISKDYWAVDWMFDLDLLINGKFKTIENGFISFGTKGISKKKEFLDRAPYKKKKIYILLPFYELMKRLFLNTIFSNKLSLVEKISLYFKSLKINIYFFLKQRIGK